MGRIAEHDRRMRRRLAIIAPFVIVAHFLCFISLGKTVSPGRMITFGYEGPPRFEPDISILDDQRATGKVSSEARDIMTVLNVFIEEEDKVPRTKGTEPAPPPAERKREQQISVATTGDDNYRSYPAHAPVPYREDYVILRMVKPEYPPDALANAEEGYVLVEAYIGTDGSVNEVWVRSAFGPRSFETASIEAVKQFLFKPIKVNGSPLSFWVSFLVRFQLRR